MTKTLKSHLKRKANLIFKNEKGKQDKFKGKKKFGSPNFKKYGQTSKLFIHERMLVAKIIKQAHAKGG